MTRRCLIACGVVGAVAADSGLRLTISLDKTRYRAGEQMRLVWTLENLSSQSVRVIAFHSAGGGPQYDELHLSVSLNGGEAHPVPTVFPRAASQPVWRDIAAGDKLQQELNLARSLALMTPKTGPGSYRLMAEYSMRPERIVASPVAFVIEAL